MELYAQIHSFDSEHIDIYQYRRFNVAGKDRERKELYGVVHADLFLETDYYPDLKDGKEVKLSVNLELITG